jgi:CubicO group peptidase (beta-lactamase class C family)
MIWKTLVPCLGVTLALTSASCSSSTTTSGTPTTSNAGSTSSAPPTTQPEGTSTSTSAPNAPFTFPLASSQALLDQLVTSTGAPGALMAVSVHGGPPTILTSGVSNPTKKLPMQPTDVMPIASVSKTFVGALILLLVRDGKVVLDAPISTYGIDFPNADVITVRELLSHTSGLPPVGGEGNRPGPNSLAWQNKLLGDLHHHFRGSADR